MESWRIKWTVNGVDARNISRSVTAWFIRGQKGMNLEWCGLTTQYFLLISTNEKKTSLNLTQFKVWQKTKYNKKLCVVDTGILRPAIYDRRRSPVALPEISPGDGPGNRRYGQRVRGGDWSWVVMAGYPWMKLSSLLISGHCCDNSLTKETAHNFENHLRFRPHYLKWWKSVANRICLTGKVKCWNPLLILISASPLHGDVKADDRFSDKSLIEWCQEENRWSG
jgi:hypothetical protein